MEKVKWTASDTDKDTWLAEMGESVPARIKKLDAKTFCVYRGGRYLGLEADLDTAQKRAAVNMRSEINREIEWQHKHRDEQPLGLRLTQEERAATWAANQPPPKAPRSVAPKAKAGGLEGVIGATPDKVGRLVPPPPPKAAPAPVLAKGDPIGKVVRDAVRRPQGDRNAELLTLLKRGCTSEEVLRVTGWQAISMPQLAKRLGVGLRIDKSGKPFRYYATKEV